MTLLNDIFQVALLKIAAQRIADAQKLLKVSYNCIQIDR